VADGVQLMTRPEFAPYLERFDTVPRTSRLSGPALEALAIVAYRQPISRIEVEYVRGVNSTGVIRTLLERGLIEGVARGEGVGRPVLSGTTSRFMEHFGLASLEDLPRLASWRRRSGSGSTGCSPGRSRCGKRST